MAQQHPHQASTVTLADPRSDARLAAACAPARGEPPPRLGLPDLGVGVGLRLPHYEAIFERLPRVDWFEIISENFMVEGGLPLYNLGRVEEHYRVVQHGVSMSIGGRDPVDVTYLKKLKALARRTKTPWLS